MLHCFSLSNACAILSTSCLLCWYTLTIIILDVFTFQPGLPGMPHLPHGPLGGALEQIKAAGNAPHLNPAFLQEMAAQNAQLGGGNMQKMVSQLYCHVMMLLFSLYDEIFPLKFLFMYVRGLNSGLHVQLAT